MCKKSKQRKDIHLLSFFNSANAADDDFVTPFKCDHLSNTVWATRVVDISGKQKERDLFQITQHDMRYYEVMVHSVYV